MAHVGVHELDARLAQARQVQLGPAPVEVVAGDELPVGVALGQGEGEGRADEAGAAGDEDAHGRNRGT